MRKFIFVSLLFGMMSVCAVAQDDMYFTPTKKDKKEVRKIQPAPIQGCNRDIDEYNRHGQFRSQYNVIGNDSTGNDIIDFVAGMPSDSTFYNGEEGYEPEDDYAYSRHMSRFDDFYWYSPWYYSSWYGSPYYWYGSPYWYARYGWGWYDPWYSPWYYSSWYYPYGWGWGGGWYPHAHYPVAARPAGRYTGTNNHGFGGMSNRRFAQRNNTERGSYNTRSLNNRSRYGNETYRYSNRNNQNTYNQNNSSRPSFNNSGSFGGSRGSFGGGSFGGSRGGGGGHFGGRR